MENQLDMIHLTDGAYIGHDKHWYYWLGANGPQKHVALEPDALIIMARYIAQTTPKLAKHMARVILENVDED